MAQLEKALKINGWMSDIELTWLAEQAGKYQQIVEIGSYLGRSTRALADNTKGVVYAIDHWYGPNEISIAPWEREGLYDLFLTNVGDLIINSKVIAVRQNHQKVKFFGNPDMAFIDGDHSYESVKSDIEKWQSATLLCGHDASWPGVRRALAELFQPDEIEFIPDTDIWMRNLKGEL